MESSFTKACQPDSFVWLDFFSLRQNKSDFDSRTVVDLIGEIGALVASPSICVECESSSRPGPSQASRAGLSPPNPRFGKI